MKTVKISNLLEPQDLRDPEPPKPSSQAEPVHSTLEDRAAIEYDATADLSDLKGGAV